MDHQLHVVVTAVSYTHLRAHETLRYLVCRLLLEKIGPSNMMHIREDNQSIIL